MNPVKTQGALETVCEFEEPYHTPAGYYDVPYVYVKNYFIPDTSALLLPPPVPPISLANSLNDAIPSDNDSDFILRKVTVVNLFGYYFNFKDALNYNYFASSAPDPTANAPNNAALVTEFAVIPEKLFPSGSVIQYYVGGQGGSIGIFEYGGITPFVAYFSVIFQGVKRFVGTPDRRANYPYQERCWWYTFPFNLNWFYLVAPFNTYTADNAHTFYIPVKDYDFELMQIGVDFPIAGFQVRIFDANSRVMSNDFVDMSALSGSATQAQGVAQVSGCFPVPGLIYPIGSVIRIDVRSLASNSTVRGDNRGPVVLYLKGVQRIPC